MNGGRDWKEYAKGNTSDTKAYCTTLQDMSTVITDTQRAIICSHLKWCSSSAIDTMNYPCIGRINGQTLIIKLFKNEVPSLNEFKKYLSNNPMEVHYPKQREIVHDYKDTNIDTMSDSCVFKFDNNIQGKFYAEIPMID
ncbi:hypothetical protein N2W52_001898 [Clostridium perfringens]|nr:hypothetical protein [Clostridium perfringens]